MQKKFDHFSQKDAARLAQTPAGQQLVALLQNQSQDTLDKIQQGNTQALQALLQDPQTAALLKQLKEAYHG